MEVGIYLLQAGLFPGQAISGFRIEGVGADRLEIGMFCLCCKAKGLFDRP